MWYLLACAYMEFLLGIKFRVSGDKFVRGESSLIIMNHRTQFDWMWLWPVLYHYARLRSIKIVLKQPLKWVPGFGWALQSAGFMFLRRNWESDQDTIGLILDYYENVESPLSTLIFPEGTCLDSEGIEKSNRYADKNNKPRYKYCLHPREKGFQFLLSELKKRKLITHVHNITMEKF